MLFLDEAFYIKLVMRSCVALTLVSPKTIAEIYFQEVKGIRRRRVCLLFLCVSIFFLPEWIRLKLAVQFLRSDCIILETYPLFRLF
jgi:hypothetical protein